MAELNTARSNHACGSYKNYTTGTKDVKTSLKWLKVMIRQHNIDNQKWHCGRLKRTKKEWQVSDIDLSRLPNIKIKRLLEREEKAREKRLRQIGD